MRGRNLSLQYFGNRLNTQFDGGFPYFDDRTITTVQAWSVASRNKVNDVWTSQLTAGEGSDDSVSQTSFGNAPFKTTQRQYFWQNDVALPLGTLGVILERREEHLTTDTDFAVTQRNTNSATGVYQLRYDDVALQANVRRDDSNQYGGKTTGGLALGYKLSPAWRVTVGRQHRLQGAVVQRPLLSGFLQPEPGAGDLEERRGRRLLERLVRRSALGGSRHRLSQPGERTDRVRVRRGFQLPAAERRPRHARGRDAGTRTSRGATRA